MYIYINLVNTDKYSYTEDGNNYVFTNVTELSAGDNIDFTYSCTVSPRNIKGGYIDENGYYQGDFYKMSFTPSIVVTDAENPLNYSRDLGIEAHTEVRAEANKSRTSVVFDWDTAWGDKPADSDEYFYVIWQLESNGAASSSQKYSYYWSEETAHDGAVVYSSPALGTKSNLITSGKYTSTVVTKHRRKDVEGELTTIKNEAIHYVEWAFYVRKRTIVVR